MWPIDTQPYQEALVVAEADVRVAWAERDRLHRDQRPEKIAQAQEASQQALAIATDVERSYYRQNRLLASGAGSRRTVDAACTARDQATAGVKAAEDATTLADTALLAPSTGTVIVRVREPGSMEASQSTVYGLSLYAPMCVCAYISEPDIGHIAPGKQAPNTGLGSELAFRFQHFALCKTNFLPLDVALFTCVDDAEGIVAELEFFYAGPVPESGSP